MFPRERRACFWWQPRAMRNGAARSGAVNNKHRAKERVSNEKGNLRRGPPTRTPRKALLARAAGRARRRRGSIVPCGRVRALVRLGGIGLLPVGVAGLVPAFRRVRLAQTEEANRGSARSANAALTGTQLRWYSTNVLSALGTANVRCTTRTQQRNTGLSPLHHRVRLSVPRDRVACAIGEFIEHSLPWGVRPHIRATPCSWVCKLEKSPS